ncbi:MAG: hypothetical protein HY806_06140 [Nitrospirae bacterium]|nr:hypothetical protein [Nitrospirota bacterium]
MKTDNSRPDPKKLFILIKLYILRDFLHTAESVDFANVMRNDGGSLLLLIVGSPFCMIFINTLIFFGFLPLFFYLTKNNSVDLSYEEQTPEVSVLELAMTGKISNQAMHI